MKPLQATSPRISLTGLLLAAALIAGCGSSSSSSSSSSASTTSSNGIASKKPAEIVAAAKQAATGATSVHVAGSIVSEGKPISLDMELVAGKGGKGKITVEGTNVSLVQVGKSVYIKGGAAFYRKLGGQAAAQLLQGKWLKAPTTSSDFASLSSLTDLSKLIDATLASHGTLAGAPSTTIDGEKAAGVTDTVKGGTLYVAETGTPYPLEIVKTGKEAGKITFEDWNKSVQLAPPPGAIDVSQLPTG
jgi:hypothetical protein